MSGDNAASVAALSATTSSFLSALALNAAIAGGEVLAWVLIRRKLKAIYEPRAFMPPPRRQVSALTPSFLGVFWEMYNSDPKLILKRNGVDAYVFVRFNRMLVKMFLPIWLLSWLVLFPVDAVHTKVEGKSGLEQLTYGNVSPDKQARLWAHLIMAWVFTGWLLYNLRGEMEQWVTIRQRHLVNPEHSRLAQANTILITGIDKHYLDEARLATLFSHLPGGVKKVWVNRNLKEMVGLHDRRVTATKKLESAQVSMIKKARTIKLNREKQVEKLTSKGKPIPDKLKQPINADITVERKKVSPSITALKEIGGEDIQLDEAIEADKLVPRSDRPTHRIKGKFPLALPFTGQVVDTIDWARKEIIQTGIQLNKSREVLAGDIVKEGIGNETYPPLNSAFIYFNQQIAAHMAGQILLHSQPYRMSGHYVEVAPSDVIWENLSLNPYDGFIRRLVSYAVTGGLILVWSIPVAFIGALSNAQSLCLTYSWMRWLCNLGNVPQGIITGVLPPVLLAVINLLLPVILRLLARFEGIPRKTDIELSLMTRYTVLLVVNSFIVLTLASGLISTLPAIAKDPSSAATILAQQLPQASTFFITYVTLQAAGIGGNLLQILSLILYYIQLILLGGTPRNAYHKRNNMQTPSWGLTFPGTTLVAIIATAYMVISPVINGLACAAFFLGYMTQKYLFTWVIDQPAASDTGGLFFPKAVTHIFVGMYIQHVCLCALFFLARNAAGNASAIPQGALMIVLIVCTVAFQYVMITSYRPLKVALPLSLAHLSYGMPRDVQRQDSFRGEELFEDEAVEQPAAHGNGDAEKKTGLAARALELANVKAKQAVNSINARDFERLNNLSRSSHRNKARMTAEEVRAAEETLEDDAFTHPAAKEPQRIIWLPEDELGLAAAEIRDNESIGIASTSNDAFLNSEGHVEVTGPPPDEYEEQE